MRARLIRTTATTAPPAQRESGSSHRSSEEAVNNQRSAKQMGWPDNEDRTMHHEGTEMEFSVPLCFVAITPAAISNAMKWRFKTWPNPPCGFRESVVAPGLASRRSLLFQVRAMPLYVVRCRRGSQPRPHATMAYCFVARWQQVKKGRHAGEGLGQFSGKRAIDVPSGLHIGNKWITRINLYPE